MSEPDAYQIQASAAWFLTVASCIFGLVSYIVAIFVPAFLKPSAIFVVTAGIGFVWMNWIGDDTWTVEIRKIYR